MPVLFERWEVDRCEVLRVRLGRSGGWRSWTAVPGETVAVVADRDLDQILGHLADLPDGEQTHCFLPRFGLRLWAGDHLRAEVAISFECNNGLTFVDGRRGWFEFDATSRPGRMLHSALTRHERYPLHSTDALTLESISAAVADLTPLIDAADTLLPVFGHSEDLSRSRIELDGGRAVYVAVAGGQERSRRSTGSLDELLYWVFADLTFRVAFIRMLRDRVEGEDPWRSVYEQQSKLLRTLDESWFERFRHANRARLDELNL